MSHQYLAIDLGAESGRAMLADLSGDLLTLQEVHRFPNVPVHLPTGLYWNTLGLFQGNADGVAGRARDRAAGERRYRYVGRGFRTAGAGWRSLDNPRHYRDTRNIGLPEEMCAVVPRGEIFAATGTQFMEINSLYQL